MTANPDPRLDEMADEVLLAEEPVHPEDVGQDPGVTEEDVRPDDLDPEAVIDETAPVDDPPAPQS